MPFPRNRKQQVRYYADSSTYACEILGAMPAGREVPVQELFSAPGEAGLSALARDLFRTNGVVTGEVTLPPTWTRLFLVDSTARSQYDLLIARAREKPRLPGGILCLAGQGTGFHGFAGRPWVGLAGNLHLSVFLAPGRAIPHFAAGFLVLAAVSAAQTIESLEIPGVTPTIKWVNDVLIAGAKVCGVLAHTQTQGSVVTGAVLGIGLNVGTPPAIGNDPCVPRACALSESIPDPDLCNQRTIFLRLVSRLADNYHELITHGPGALLDYYLCRCSVTGKRVAVFDQGREIARGTVRAIGEDLELYLEGHTAPITGGRLALL